MISFSIKSITSLYSSNVLSSISIVLLTDLLCDFSLIAEDESPCDSLIELCLYLLTFWFFDPFLDPVSDCSYLVIDELLLFNPSPIFKSFSNVPILSSFSLNFFSYSCSFSYSFLFSSLSLYVSFCS